MKIDAGLIAANLAEVIGAALEKSVRSLFAKLDAARVNVCVGPRTLSLRPLCAAWLSAALARFPEEAGKRAPHGDCDLLPQVIAVHLIVDVAPDDRLDAGGMCDENTLKFSRRTMGHAGHGNGGGV